MNWFLFKKFNTMIIFGFEDSNGNPVVKTEEEKKIFLEKSGYKEEDVKFADDDTTIPTTMKAIAAMENINNK